MSEPVVKPCRASSGRSARKACARRRPPDRHRGSDCRRRGPRQGGIASRTRDLPTSGLAPEVSADVEVVQRACRPRVAERRRTSRRPRPAVISSHASSQARVASSAARAWASAMRFASTSAAVLVRFIDATLRSENMLNEDVGPSVASTPNPSLMPFTDRSAKSLPRASALAITMPCPIPPCMAPARNAGSSLNTSMTTTATSLAVLFACPATSSSLSPTRSSDSTVRADMTAAELARSSKLAMRDGSSSAPAFPKSSVATCTRRTGSSILPTSTAIARNCWSGLICMKPSTAMPSPLSAPIAESSPSPRRFCSMDTAPVICSRVFPDCSATYFSRCTASVLIPVLSASFTRASASFEQRLPERRHGPDAEADAERAKETVDGPQGSA